jgi:hypothetical protein
MITLDAVRAAVLADEPYARMDELVRAEMAAGRRVNDIFESLRPLADDVLETPSLSADGEEAFLGTLDALTGMCHTDCQYSDPPDLAPHAPDWPGATPSAAPDGVRR